MAKNSEGYFRVKDEGLEEPSLPLWRKLCFAVGGMPYQMTTTVIGFFLSIFLLEVAQLKPSYVAVVLFAGKAWDAVTDPLCGFLVQRTRTRWGRLRPWILFSAPFASAVFFLLFYVPGSYRPEEAGKKPETEISMEGKLGYYLAMFCLFEGLMSGLHVPYTSLTMSVTTKQSERDSITAYRMCFEAIGVLAAVLIQGQLVQGTRCNGDEEKDDQQTKTVKDMMDQEWSYRTGSLVVAGFYMLCSLVVFFGTKEKEVKDDMKEAPSFFAGLKLVFSYGPYVKAAITFLFLSMAIGIVQGNVALYCTHALKMGDRFSIYILVLLCVSIVAMPVWQHVVVRFGKKTTYASGMIILIPAFFTQLYVPEKSEVLYFVVIVLGGLGTSVALLMPWSVLPDVLDLFMLERKRRQDAIFYAFYVFFQKLAIGLGLAVSQVALSLGHYRSGECKQPDSVDQTLRLLVTPGPVVCILIALVSLWLYPIDETRRRQIREDVLLYQERAGSRLDTSQATVSYDSITVPGNSASKDVTRL